MGRSILIIDGSVQVQGIIGRALMENGCRPVAAANVAQALRSLETEVPHLILLEMTTPAATAAQFLKLLKGNPDWSHLQVIILADEKTVADARKLPATRVIIKDEQLANNLIEFTAQIFAAVPDVDVAPRSMLF